MRKPLAGTRRLLACVLAVGLLAPGPAATPVAAGSTPFTDIGGSSFVHEIEWLYQSGITAGCTPTTFCPTAPVTRGQMASFLVRALKLPIAVSDHFTDDTGTTHEGDINRLFESGITKGCSPTTYCPTANVTRAQMASFLVRAFGLPTPPGGTGDAFTDDNGTTHEADINRLAYSGITKGCSATLYCPTSSVTREQMAAFLYRSFHNPASCDGQLASSGLDPLDSAKALGLCAREGLKSAAWTLPDGEDMPVKPTNYDLGHSIRDDFGPNVTVREGTNMVVLSTAAAAAAGDTNPPYDSGDLNKGYSSALPPDFPLAQEHVRPEGVQACPDLIAQGNDGIGLRLEVTAPPGATAFSIDWKYYSRDYPYYICTPFVDAAAILLDGANVLEVADRTVTANTVSEICQSGTTGEGGTNLASHTCTFGTAELAGTGFDAPDSNGDLGAASTWQTLTVPVTPFQTYTIVLTIWDTSDGTLKSTVLFDNFRWVD